VSVFVVVFLKAERVVVLGFPDVLRNQRSEVLKNFKKLNAPNRKEETLNPKLTFKFNKRAQFFVGMRNEALSVVAVRVNNPDRSPVGING